MDLKPVIALSDDLPSGLKANIAAVMGMSLGRYRPGLIGVEAYTADRTKLPGITTVPVPVLSADRARLSELFAQAGNLDLVVPFGEAALTTKNYNDYQVKLATLPDADQGIVGLLLVGSKKAVNKLVGQLPLLR
ncbi:MAG: DUF2000 domain-containing protein [Sphingomonadaceae bacterium]